MAKIKGLKELLKNLEKFGSEGLDVIESVTEVTAKEIEFNAKNYAPLKFGKLKQSIKAIPVNNLNWKVLANATGLAPYAAYMEFGTGGLVEVPEELKEVAIRFKGKGIKKININPRPYLYPALLKGRKQYLIDLEDELNNLTKKI